MEFVVFFSFFPFFSFLCFILFGFSFSSAFEQIFHFENLYKHIQPEVWPASLTKRKTKVIDRFFAEENWLSPKRFEKIKTNDNGFVHTDSHLHTHTNAHSQYLRQSQLRVLWNCETVDFDFWCTERIYRCRFSAKSPAKNTSNTPSKHMILFNKWLLVKRTRRKKENDKNENRGEGWIMKRMIINRVQGTARTKRKKRNNKQNKKNDEKSAQVSRTSTENIIFNNLRLRYRSGQWIMSDVILWK